MSSNAAGADLKKLLDVARAATAVSREILERGRRQRTAPVSQIGRDIKMPEDEASERLIRAFLTEQSGLPVLGEEQGWSGESEGADLHWAIDPLDGSYNYFKGIPIYAVSVALCRGRTPLLGAIRDPERDETFSGGPGLGLFCNDAPVAAAKAGRDVLATGFPVRADIEHTVSRIVASTVSFKKIRMLGSAALSLAWVAAGRLDGYEEDGIMWWDVAAGVALGAAAGCAVEIAGEGSGPLRVSVIRP